MSIIEDAPLDAEKLEQFVLRAVDEVGATLNAALVVMGDRLGLYRALAGAGELTSGELAARTGPASATCANGSTPRPPAASSSTTPPKVATAWRPSRPSR